MAFNYLSNKSVHAIKKDMRNPYEVFVEEDLILKLNQI
jgi:hypothetical protein